MSTCRPCRTVRPPPAAPCLGDTTMRRLALPLLLALSSLAFAPAPLPKRETAQQREKREVAECARLLGELGVKWSVAAGRGGQVVRYFVEVSQATRSGSMHGEQDVA